MRVAKITSSIKKNSDSVMRCVKYAKIPIAIEASNAGNTGFTIEKSTNLFATINTNIDEKEIRREAKPTPL